MFERLALPGFGRARRFDLLSALGAAGRYELTAGDGLLLGKEEDATTLAAKRLLVSGDRLLLDRRAASWPRPAGCRSARSTAASRSGAAGRGRDPAGEAPAARPRGAGLQ